MNEGESAGGGHQGSNPVPPAVPERNSAQPTKLSSTSTIKNNNNSNSGSTVSQTSPSVLTLVTTYSLLPGTTTTTSTAVATSSHTPRSFQQAFTQQQRQQQLQLQKQQSVATLVRQQNLRQHTVPMPQNSSARLIATGPGSGSQNSQSDTLNFTLNTTPSNRAYVPPTLSNNTESLGHEHPPLAKRPRLQNITTDPPTSVPSKEFLSLLPAISTSTIGETLSATNVQEHGSEVMKKAFEELIHFQTSRRECLNELIFVCFSLDSGKDFDSNGVCPDLEKMPEFISFCNKFSFNRIKNEVIPNEETPTTATSENLATIIGGPVSDQEQESQRNEETKKMSTTPQLSSNLAAGSLQKSSTLTSKNTSNSSLPSVDESGNILPQGAEIKIPAVGATPVAVSTKLPAAVVQLSQKGHIPGRPLGGRHGMVFGQIPTPPAVGNSSIPLVPGGTPLVPCSTGTGGTALRRNGNGTTSQISLSTQSVQSLGTSPLFCSAPGALLIPANKNVNSSGGGAAASSPQEFSFKAKQEVCVMKRISELQREGLWTEKRLPKIQEPSRPKAHWDYLLEEMVWLAADFAQERKWKKNAAKKCAKMVQKYFQDKANAAQKAEKAQEAHLKRVAAFIAKEIKCFWSSVEKLVEYKHQSKIEEKRKKALDQHLSFIVDQTEKFSQQLVEGMNKTSADVTMGSVPHSINSSRISSPKPHESQMASDDEFRPNTDSEDDEETIARAEAEASDVKEEVAALKKESQMELDDFLNDLPEGYLENRDKILLDESKTTKKDPPSSDDSEFEANETSDDDEHTIIKEEEQDANMDYEQELNELEADNEIPVEELLKKYKSGQICGGEKIDDKTTKKETVTDDEENVLDSDDESTIIESISTSDDETMDETSSETDETEQKDEDGEGLKKLLEDADTSNKDAIINDAAALAESIQPKGNTLSSTNVVTPVPFLLKHTLREYQHIGLDWLVTMHDRKLNGILADEMGLGKTIQTIALLAHLACVKGNWGPHLIVVPSSVMLNWEMEFKKWCPGFKILTYYGSQKERKLKRVGWTKPNAFHVCITSYKLVVQDQQSFRRKKWKYLILDEAQNIKNFKSQRWQLLLNFVTERRLLLTGTPLQNDLMELWSLMHFLMPYVFSSHREFKEWFSNPMTGMIEGNLEYNETLISRLHKVIRPFLLRRLKKEVEKQMPSKYEHVVMCRLSNRQRYLYDDFMSRTKTKETLQTGNLLSVINVLMQLRKVCNHPNMFEVRPTISPFQMDRIDFQIPRVVCDLFEYDPCKNIDLHTFNLQLIDLETTITAYVAHKSRLIATPRKLIEEIDTLPDIKSSCPKENCKFYVRILKPEVENKLRAHGENQVQIGASPVMKTENHKIVPVYTAETVSNRIATRINHVINPVHRQRIESSRPIVTSSIEIADELVKEEKTASPLPNLQESTSIKTTLGRSETEKSRKDRMAFLKEFVEQARDIKEEKQKRRMSFEQESLKRRKSETLSLVEQERKESRGARLKLMATINSRRVEAVPIYGEDCRQSLEKLITHSRRLAYSNWHTRSYTNCNAAMQRCDDWTLNKMLKSYEQKIVELRQIFENFVIYVPAASAPRIRFYTNNLTSPRVQKVHDIEKKIIQEISPKLSILHPIVSSMTTQFPDPRLIQYDCGKLQTLNVLLRQLKSEQHRVLIFTQMTKMLDILEAFLNYHGHRYLRLDGSTRVEQRQVLMERFNGDKRIFCFILSTRSGGVGINLTGADTVIFYDSDWNPTMDAQAQDRCHRIGQTRDVHIYRLVSEKTIEVNILKKAHQKRMLSDMAIEGGNFTTSFFKSSTIKDLFNLEQNDQDIDTSASTSTNKPETHLATITTSTTSTGETNSQLESEKQSLRVFESALAAAEDEQDVQATKIANAEAAADLEEFDETIPIEEPPAPETATEMSKADLEMENIVKQLSPVERYAMRFVEATGTWSAAQLRVAEEEFEAQKREWEANRIAALQKEEEILKQESETIDILTYSRKDALNQVWISGNTMEKMPMWCPPTPPQDDNDVYIDYSLSFMYDIEPIPETDLPPVYIKRDHKRSRSDAGFLDGTRRPPKVRREEIYFAPRSLFDRPTAAIARIRRDLKNQRFKGVFKPNIQIPGLKPQSPPKPLIEPEGMAEWCIFEDFAMLNVIVNLQGLPCNLMQLSPGHTPNWDLVSEIVNFFSKTYRSPKHCRWRYEAVIQAREEGKLIESPKKQKKLKTSLKAEFLKGPLRALRTTQLYANDNNMSFTKLMRSRFDFIKAAYLKKSPPPKRQFSTSNHPVMNPKHLEVLQEFGVVNYDHPIPPLNIAVMKSNKRREQQRSHLAALPPPAGPVAHGVQQTPVAASPHLQQQPQQQATPQAQVLPSSQIQEIVVQQQQQGVTASGSVTQVMPATTAPLHTQQLQIQHISSNSSIGVVQPTTATAIVLQHAGTLPSHQQQSSLSGASTVQTQPQIMRSIIGSHTPNTQIVKAIVTPQTGVLTQSGQMHQLTQQVPTSTTTTQHIQLQQPNSANLIGAPASVSVVLTTPVQTISSNVQSAQQQHPVAQASSTAQIVSISPQTVVTSPAQVSNIVSSQSLPQVVSVSQLSGTVGTVLTTSSSLQQNATTVTTLNPSALRAQRIVATSSATLQDVVLQQRSTNPNATATISAPLKVTLDPTIVSMSSISQNITPAQFQAQLRLTSMASGTQQITKGIPVSSLQQSCKIAPTSSAGSSQSAHIQFYRQRQQLKVLQTAAPGQGNQVGQTSMGNQTTLVNAAGTIIQGNVMQTSSGSTTVQVMPSQKLAVATVSSSGVVASQSGVVSSPAGTTVQVTHNQGRTQFIKQMATSKQGITRQIGDDNMLVVKRQVIGHQKSQVIQQSQIFTTASQTPVSAVQLQQQSQLTAGSVGPQQAAGQTQTQVQQVTPQQIATLVKTGGSMTASSQNSNITGTPGTMNMALSQLKPGGQIKVTTMASQQQMRQLHMQPHLNLPPRKISRMAAQANAAIVSNQQSSNQATQVTTGAQVSSQKPTQLVHIQNTKSLPSSVTVQHIQQVMRQGQPGTLATTGLVLGKTSVGRVIPVSVASSPANQRPTIQVVSAASAQALAAGNIRAHVGSGQNIAGTIKVATSGGGQQAPQAFITAIQQQAVSQQSQRQNASPVRLQTTASGGLVAVVQQQNVVSSSGGNAQADVMTITQSSSSGTVCSSTNIQQQQQLSVQTSTTQEQRTQQVRTLVKKKIMQREKE